MSESHVIHIRRPIERVTSFCGLNERIGESISLSHYNVHTKDNRGGCCAYTWTRLCPACRGTMYREGLE